MIIMIHHSFIHSFIHSELKYADLILYQISPTTAIPATLGMLDPDEEFADSIIYNNSIYLYDTIHEC